MAFGPGRLGVLKIDNGAGSLTDLSAYMTKVDCTFGVTTGDTTTFGATAETLIPTIKQSAKLTFTCLIDPTPAVQLDTIDTNGGGLTTTNASISVEYGPMGSATGNPKYTFEGFLTSLKPSVAVKDIPSLDGQIDATGVVTSGVYP